jgi:hypothetical protein
MITPEQQKWNRMVAMKFFIAEGFTPAQAAGFVGNFMQESGMDPGIHQIGGGGGVYLAQWTWPPRKKGLHKFAEDQGLSVTDLMLQLRYVIHEITSPEFAKTLDAIKKADSVGEATIIICNKYEAPGVPHLDRRIKYANQAMREYMILDLNTEDHDNVRD